MEDVLGPDGYGDSGLDMVADLRRDMLRDLVEHELPTMTLADLHARFAYLRELDSIDKDQIKDALFRDLTTMVEREAIRLMCPSFRSRQKTALSENPTVTSPSSLFVHARPTRHDRRLAARRSQPKRSAHSAGLRLLADDGWESSAGARSQRRDAICPPQWTDVRNGFHQFEPDGSDA